MALMIHERARQRLDALKRGADGPGGGELRKGLEQLLTVYPDFAPAWRSLGALQRSLGEILQALESFQRCIAVDSCDVDGWVALARLHFEMLNEPEDAIQALKRALGVEANHPEAIALRIQIERATACQAAHDDGAPLVSAIVSTYKSEKFLRGCLEDLEAQTIAGKLEIIVIDSNSPENERAIVEEFQKRHSNIVYIRTEARETVYAAWNRGVKGARGKYLTNANTDDRHRPDAFAVLARTLEGRPDIALAYADCLITPVENETFETTKATRKFEWLEFTPQDLLLKGCFCGPQPMWRRAVHDEHGWFDPEFVSAGDYEFWLKIARAKKFLHVKETLGLYLESPTSVEHANAERAAWEVAEARRRHGPAIVQGYRVEQMPARPEAAKTKAAPIQRAKSITLPPVARIANPAEARELFGQRKYQAAWKAASEAIAKRPYHPEAYLLLAEIALGAGDGNMARQCAQRAKELAPEWSPAKQFLKGKLRGQLKQEWMTMPATQAEPRLTVCLIVRNEEAFLGQCLASVKDLAAQIIVVDTGSTDRTVEIARSHGAETYSFAWCDDFSAARNAALERATGDWVLSLDADEELLPEHKETLRQEMRNASALGYRLPIIDKGREQNGCSYVPRLFRNAPGLFYLGRVHEQAFSSVQVRCQQWGLKHLLGRSALLHHGYTAELMASRNKIERNLRLLEKAIEELPGEPSLLMSYGLELVRSDKLEAGLQQYELALRAVAEMPVAEVTPELRETLLTQLTTHLMAAKRFEDIVSLWQSPAARACAQTASQHFSLGLAQMELKQPAAAAEQFRQCLAKREQAALSPINPEILRGGPLHCLALCHAALKQNAAAEESFRAAIASEPRARASRFNFARFLADTGNAIDALKTLNELTVENSADLAAWQFGAELALGKREFIEFACDWTEAAVKQFPDQPSIILLRAEALFLAQRADQALLFWRDARLPKHPRRAAAAALCEALGEDCQTGVAADQEQAVSLEALKWYRRLIAVGANGLAYRLHEKMETLRLTLPSFVAIWETAMRKASAAVAA